MRGNIMLSPEESVAFKQEYGNELLVDMMGVSIRPSENKLMSYNIKAPKEKIEEIRNFFLGFKLSEPIFIDIAATGNIHCYFKGVSPIVDKPDYSFISVMVQELQKELVDAEEAMGIPAHECVGCGFHDTMPQ